MTLPTGNKRTSGSSASRSRAAGPGFTLIELILVLAMLMIVISLAAPSLSGFFRGRSLDSEAKRFLALTRYGQSRAVSEGIPMVLWIDTDLGAYGLQAENSFTEDDPKAVEFTLTNRIQVVVDTPLVRTQSVAWKATAQIAGKMPAIRFTPDGTISDSSPERVLFREGEDNEIWIGHSRNRLNYEIQTNIVQTVRR